VNAGSVLAQFGASIGNYMSGLSSMQSGTAAWKNNVQSAMTAGRGHIEQMGAATERVRGSFVSGFRSMLGGALSFAAGIGIFTLASKAIGWLADQFKACMKEASDAELELAQTNAVLKSTHGIAGITASAVLALADHFSTLTRFTDDQVQSAENVLLTFTSIGKSIFPQTTQAVLDLATAMGEDWKSAALQVGKALNDPIAGLTALRRVGVQFTDAQKELIKHLIATGDRLGAQKLILAELNREFGKSAIAAGKTFAGQLAILGQNLDNVRQAIGEMLKGPGRDFLAWINSHVIPSLQAGVKWVGDFIGELGKPAFKSTVKDLGKAFGDLGGAINGIIQIFIPVAPHMASAKDAAKGLSDVIKGLTGFVKGLADNINKAKPTIVGIKEWLEEAGKKIKKAWDDLQPTFKFIWGLIQQLGVFVRDTFAPAWKDLKETLVKLNPLWQQFVAAIGPALPALKILGLVLGALVALPLLGFIKTLGMLAQGAVLAFGIIATIVLMAGTGFLRFLAQVTAVVNWIIVAWNHLKALSDQIWHAIMHAIEGAVVNGINSLKVRWDFIVKWLSDTWNNMVKGATAWGQGLINNILAGLKSAWEAVVTWFLARLAWLKGLWPHSPVKEGPLVGYENWGYIFGMGIASGLWRSIPELERAAEALAGAMPRELAASVGVTGGTMAGALAGNSRAVQLLDRAVSLLERIEKKDPTLVMDGDIMAATLGPHMAAARTLRYGRLDRR